MKRITATLSAAALTLVLSACGAGDGQTPQTDPALPGSGMDRDSSTPQSVPGDMNAPDTGSSFGDDQPGAGMDGPTPGSGNQR